MDQTATTSPQPQTDKEIIAEIDRLFTEIEAMSRETRTLQAQTDILREETRANLAAADKLLGL
jgi:hypothetical protein